MCCHKCIHLEWELWYKSLTSNNDYSLALFKNLKDVEHDEKDDTTNDKLHGVTAPYGQRVILKGDHINQIVGTFIISLCDNYLIF